MNKHQEMQRLIRLYKETTGEVEVDMHKVAKFANERGWPLPKPRDPFDMLAKEFAQAARQEFRTDSKTGKPYRANHALPSTVRGVQLTLWIDIDEAPRHQMLKSLINRREQMVGDGLQLSLDADHWNGIHEGEEPIDIPMDLTDDIEWRKNAPDDESEAA
ncbi:hypothetical protein WI99_25160 [Burkholderia cepacia]|uniref:Uncharacterized protein n=1 Tax=Trinickia terrae TaxID=2571161 RepID=A0A4U1IDH6_9BURK|nr:MULTISPECIES: hypothetical protein [Burkholderiaceae]KVE81062.1 hypothetical protein WI99_25160 [Burkholderia cepacia]TKC91716.1 hypothetical protein FAZ69_04550 [Trinickia terrae]